MAYILIFTCEMFATGGHVFSATTSSNVTSIAANSTAILIAPNVAEGTSWFIAMWATVTHVAAYLKVILQIFYLWCPTVFSDPNMLWFWWCICFPVDCGMVASIVFIVRGVHSA